MLVVDRLFSDISACSDKLDALLQGSHRYRSARLIGQLDKAEIIVNPLAEDTYLNHFTKAGMRRGNIKHRYLFNKPFDSLINVGSYENHV